MRRRIFWGVLLAAIVALLIGLTAGAVIRQQQISANRTELNRQAEVTANLIGAELGPSLRADDRGEVRQILRQLRLIGGYDYLEAAIITEDGFTPIVRDPILLPQFRAGSIDVRAVRRLDIDGTPVFATTRGVDVGRIRLLIAIGREEPLLSSGAFTRPLAVGLVVGVLLALAVSWLVSRR